MRLHRVTVAALFAWQTGSFVIAEGIEDEETLVDLPALSEELPSA